jgi:fluoride exporter
VTWLLAVAGGMVGAPVRYLVDVALTARFGPGFPLGTLVANASGCLLLGVVAGVGLGSGSAAYVLLGTGVAGAMSTYSTFTFETVRLAEEGRGRRAAAYALVSALVGLAALAVGLAMT